MRQNVVLCRLASVSADRRGSSHRHLGARPCWHLYATTATLLVMHSVTDRRTDVQTTWRCQNYCVIIIIIIIIRALVVRQWSECPVAQFNELNTCNKTMKSKTVAVRSSKSQGGANSQSQQLHHITFGSGGSRICQGEGSGPWREPSTSLQQGLGRRAPGI